MHTAPEAYFLYASGAFRIQICNKCLTGNSDKYGIFINLIYYVLEKTCHVGNQFLDGGGA